MIVHLVCRGGVCHIAVPSKGIVASHRRIKVENRFSVFIKSDSHRITDGIIFGQHSGHGDVANARRLITNKGKSFNDARTSGAQLKSNVIYADSNWIAIVGCFNR